MRASPSTIVPAIVNGIGSDAECASKRLGGSGSAPDVTVIRGGFTASTLNVSESLSVCVTGTITPFGFGSDHVAVTLIVNVSAPRNPAGTAVCTDHDSPSVTSNLVLLPFGKVTVTAGLPI